MRGREARFYSRVLSTGESPLWREDLMNNRGMPIIGLGGSALMHAKDNDGKSQWAVLLDPDAAAFGIIPVIPVEAIPASDGAALPDAAAVGRISWLDLTHPDASATQDFYRQVVGWSVQHAEIEDGGERYADYHLLREDGNPVAGVRHARGMNAGLPRVWMIYLPVGDLAESLRRVQEEGGKVIQAMRGEAGEYVYAAVQDPVGAYLALTAASRSFSARRWAAGAT